MKYFKLSEFDCHYTGKNRMDPEFLEKLDNLRASCGFSFVVTSGYRDKEHPVEEAKETPGTHNLGIAADIKVTNGSQRFTLVQKALEQGFTGIGVARDFVHLDTRGTTPVMWTY